MGAVKLNATRGKLYQIATEEGWDIPFYLTWMPLFTTRDAHVKHRAETGADPLDLAGKNSELAEIVAQSELPIAGLPLPGAGHGKYPYRWLVRANIYRELHEDLDSFHSLSIHLESRPDVARTFGFANVPHHDTFRQAWKRLTERQARQANRFIEQIASVARDHNIPNVDPGRGGHVTEQPAPSTPSLTEQEKDRAFDRIEGALTDIIDFERDDNTSIPHDDLVDFAGFLARRNTFPEQGVERYWTEDDDAPRFSPETFRRAVRNKERDRRDIPGLPEWTPPTDWSVETDERGDESTWHGTTEAGIEKLLDRLKGTGALDEEVPVCLDGSIRPYHKHPTTESRPPDGVYQEAYLKTNYGWKDLTASAIINGRSVVLANISMVPGDKFFEGVKYLVDRVNELVDVEAFYADAEFCNTDILRYIDQKGCDYIFKKPHRKPTPEALEEFEGSADWTRFEMQSTRKNITHTTTLFAVEKRGIGTEAGIKRDDTTEQTGLDDYGVDSDGQAELEDYEPTEDIEYVAFATNRKITSEGIEPSENPIGHDRRNTVWGLAGKYRRRWSIETTFRQVKYQFMAKTTSRDLGARRFYWMLALLLYDAWAVLNLLVQSSVPGVGEDRPPVRAKVFLERLARGEPPPD